VSVLPKETEFGRKREIDQSNCNKDYSCVNGFCPSFVTVHGGQPRKGSKRDASTLLDNLPAPTIRGTLEQPWNILITGVGGTGVVTIGALLGMAGHLEGKGATVLDQTGLAQKGGAVTTHIRIAAARMTSTPCASPPVRPTWCWAATWWWSTTTGRCRRCAPAVRRWC
jgi:indolepyruvate ferredoxin oxidoreductase